MPDPQTTLEGLIKQTAGDVFYAFDSMTSFEAKKKSMELIADATVKAFDMGKGEPEQTPRCPGCGNRDWKTEGQFICCKSCGLTCKKPKGMP